MTGANLSETAKRWTFSDGRGEIGIIAPVSEPFCGHCNRIRLTADGQIRTCLFSNAEHNLRDLIRSDAGRAEIVVDSVSRCVVLRFYDGKLLIGGKSAPFFDGTYGLVVRGDPAKWRAAALSFVKSE